MKKVPISPAVGGSKQGGDVLVSPPTALQVNFIPVQFDVYFISFEADLLLFRVWKLHVSRSLCERIMFVSLNTASIKTFQQRFDSELLALSELAPGQLSSEIFSC